MSVAYPDDRHFSARQDLYRTQRPVHDLPAIAVRELAGATGPVVDVGCGNGRYLDRLRRDRPDLRAIGMDLSVGMARCVPPPVVVADAARLPLADGAAGGLLAMHMLYHLADVRAGVHELRRVLRPEGVLVVATNSADDKWELHEIWARAHARLHRSTEVPRISFSNRFPLEAAPGLLGEVFGEVRVVALDSAIVLDRSEPVLRYFESYLPTLGVVGGADPDALLSAVRDEVAAELDRSGMLRISCRGGIVACR